MPNSVNEDQDKLDQSQSMAMEDSTAITIEFLRARLLAERSISKTSRQQADELAKRVVELEEQLKLVTLQRKKAEKATTEVLAILENHGICDLSEVHDSSSDQEGVGIESKEVEDLKKEEVSLTTSRPMNIKVEGSSGLEFRASPLIGRSLSWNSFSDSLNSLENAKFLEETRRDRSFASTVGSSSGHNLGKPCRLINQRKTRSAEVEVNDESVLLDTQENAVATRFGDASNCIADIPKMTKERCNDDKEKVHVRCERNAEMERALEHEARLIDQFEVEENAQREWEKKFKENNCYSSDSNEQGNHSDITEERDENKAETSETIGTIPSLGQEGKSELEQACYNGEAMTKDLSNPSLLQSHHTNGLSQEKQYVSSPVHHSQNTNPEFSFLGQENQKAKSNDKWKQDSSENNSIRSASTSYGSFEHQATRLSSIHVSGGLYKGESSSNNRIQVSTYNGTPNSLGGVLDALQQAKISLKHKLNILALPAGGGPVVSTTELPASSAITAGYAMDIPVGCAGLFRVPTSSELEVPAMPNSSAHYPDPKSSLARFYPGLRIESGADARYTSRPHSHRSSVSSTHQPLGDPCMGLPSTRFMYPSYVDLMPRMPLNDGLSRNNLNMGLGDRYSEYNDRLRSDMYKR